MTWHVGRDSNPRPSGSKSHAEARLEEGEVIR